LAAKEFKGNPQTVSHFFRLNDDDDKSYYIKRYQPANQRNQRAKKGN
jgi:hypothetical protein